MPRLGDMLLAQKLLTPAQLEEALEMQVLHGGKLGTNLVELGLIAEKDLARLLGGYFNMPFAFGEMQADPAALALVDTRWIDDHEIVPMRLDTTRLTVAVMRPATPSAIDELGFKTGKRVAQVIVPESRMHELLRHHCKVFRPLRPVDALEFRALDQRKRSNAPPELINESDFAELYHQAPVAEPQRVEQPSVPTAASESSPIGFAEAQRRVTESHNREDIAQAVLRFAVSKFQRAVLLSVHGTFVSGWHGLGQGLDDRHVRHVAISLLTPSAFQLVRDLRSHFAGPMQKNAETDAFYLALNSSYPKTAVIAPLSVGAKMVHLLYLDNGPNEVTPPDVGELLILSQAVARRYEAIIRQKKAQFTGRS